MAWRCLGAQIDDTDVEVVDTVWDTIQRMLCSSLLWRVCVVVVSFAEMVMKEGEQTHRVAKGSQIYHFFVNPVCYPHQAAYHLFPFSLYLQLGEPNCFYVVVRCVQRAIFSQLLPARKRRLW